MIKAVVTFLIIFLASQSTFAGPDVCLNFFSTSASFKYIQKKYGISQLDVENIQSEAIDYFAKHFRIPTAAELARAAKVPRHKVEAIYEDQDLFWQDVFISHQRKIEDMREVLARSYYNSIRELRRGGITPRTVTVQELFVQLTKDNKVLEKDEHKGSFELKHLQRLLGLRARRPDRAQYPVLFKDVESVRLAAKEKFPSAFKGFRDHKYGLKYNEETIDLLKNKYNGFLATSFMGGIPWNHGQFRALEKIAEAKNLLIFIKEINGDTDAIPAEIVNSPRVRVITHTLDLGDALRVWGGLVILPTNKNPLAGLLERSMARKRGQIQIVFAPQRAMLPVGTEKNHIVGPHQVWATGSLNEPIYPYSNYRSSRVNNMAKERHNNSALIVEKSDRFSGPLEQGAPGRWHIRNLDFEKAISDGNNQWPAGIVDSFMFYPADGSAPRPISAVAAVPGDFHHGFQNEALLKAMDEQIFRTSRTAGKSVGFMRLHDFMDFDTISPWDSAASRSKKMSSGRLDLQAEINQARSYINAQLRLEPELKIILNSADNHNAWLMRQIENPEALLDPVNGPLLLELRQARDNGFDVFEYLFLHQQKFDEAIPDGMLRDKKLNKNVYIQKPQNIIVLRKGQTYEVGPLLRNWLLSQHGDKIDRGRKAGSSLEPHAKAADRIVIGHTHEAGMIAYAFNPGMIIRLRSQEYALNGYSTQQNAVVVIYENGSAQLFIYDPAIGRFYADTKLGILPAEMFFREETFIVPDDNDMVETGTQVINNYERSPVR